MATITKAQLETLAVDETCPTCAAKPGHKCVNMTATRDGSHPELKHPHEARTQAAQASADQASDTGAIDDLAAHLADAEKVADEHSGDAGSPAETEGDAEAQLATSCVECGFTFSRPQRKSTCQVKAACDKRKAKKAAETASA